MKFLILILVLSLNTAFASNECSRFSDDCQYYLCIAEEKHCDEFSYPVQFGHQFCLRYGANIKSFSTDGKRWVEDVRRCLIEDMSKFQDDLTCSELRPRAFQGHIPCYLESGYCELSLLDQRAVMKTIWPTLNNVEVLIGGINIFKSCLTE